MVGEPKGSKVYAEAEGFVQAGLKWLSQHYQECGSSKYRHLPTPELYVKLVEEVGEALRRWGA